MSSSWSVCASTACSRSIAKTRRGKLSRRWRRLGDEALHRYFTASVRPEEPVPRTRRAYVESLFDDYAPDPSITCCKNLRYQASNSYLLAPLLAEGRCWSHLDLAVAVVFMPALNLFVAWTVHVSRVIIEQASASGAHRCTWSMRNCRSRADDRST
jgi:hypothetical protein